MKKMTFCEQNLELGTKKVLDYAKDNLTKEFKISTTRCLGECGLCFSNCIVDLHGKLLVSENPEGLIELIKNEVQND
ncbi:MAG: DUF1450 domain-containing protein [Clostridia bacterium]